jgi:hypothetical protein
MYKERFQQYKTITHNDKIIADITKRITLIPDARNDDAICGNYYIRDGETAHSLAQDFYNESDHYWLILLVNQITDPFFQWPLTTVEFERYMDFRYGLQADVVRHYLWNEREYETSPNLEAYPVTNREHENNLNESRRKIKVVREQWLSKVIEEHKRLLS